jgi:hypothetical protein
MNHPVLEYLKTHGELPAAKIYVPNMTLGGIKNVLRKFYLDGVVLRREVVMEGWKNRMYMTYSLSGAEPQPRSRPHRSHKTLQAAALRKEPEYAYFLRNLPRTNND